MGLVLTSQHPSAVRLPLRIRVIAALMRHLPVEVRRVRIWRDKLYEALGAGGWDENDAVDSAWPRSLQGPIGGRLSGMKMTLDLTDWLQRRTYFTGRFYQEDLEVLMAALIRPGDTFVDVGANIGLVTLHAAGLVGSSGTVWAFEPNPEAFARLSDHIKMNGLACRAFNQGLGDRVDTLTLRRFGRHAGKATLINRPDEAAETVSVEICRGDAALNELDSAKPTFFKIDVEGFEVAVLEGLGKILEGNVAVVVEISRSWLKLAGSSTQRLHTMLEKHGLKPYSFFLSEARYDRKLVIKPLPGPIDEEQYDCLFMRPNSEFADRAKSFVHAV